MSTITRELAKLFRKITNSEIDAEGNAHVVLSPADSLLINNARIALASLEAEAVYQYWCYTTVENSEGDQEEFWFWNDCDKDWFDRIDCKKRMLFTAPPAPVSVPDEVTAEDCPAFVKYDVTDVDEAWARGFNACRAAMLQEVK